MSVHTLQAIGARPAARVNDRPLRVALFSGNYNYVRDGANMTLNRLVAHVERRGGKVLVFSPTTRTPAFEPAGTLVSTPSIPIPGRREYRLSFGLSAAARRRLDAFGPDIVHVSAPDILNHGAVRYAEKRGISIVASYHTRFESYLSYYGLGWLQPLIVDGLRRFYRRCDYVYAPSESMADVLRAQRLSNNLRIWSRGVDRELFNPARRDDAVRADWGLSGDDVAVGFVGRLVVEKGLDAFADAMHALQATTGGRFRPVVIGDGPARQHMERRLPNAVFTGFLSGTHMARAYAALDVFFNPSETETFGNVTLEAMASGVPMVCVDATGSRSLVAHGETGFLTPSGDRERAAAAIGALVRDPALRARMGRAAHARSAAYEWDAMLDTVLSGYLTLASQRSLRDGASDEVA